MKRLDQSGGQNRRAKKRKGHKDVVRRQYKVEIRENARSREWRVRSPRKDDKYEAPYTR